VRAGKFPHRETAEIESGSREAEAGEQEESQSEFRVSRSFSQEKHFVSPFQTATQSAPKPIIDQNDLADLNYKEMLSLLTDQSQPLESAPLQVQDPNCTCAPNAFQYFYDFQQAYYGSNPYL
jgi:hypothetical protein